ncbi:DUF4275 family protein [Lutispora thermophila]|uniref:DUF4275 domain-containing protein n=1 Tax=Lutispora thermophila DSM 19022 TaxID=1122184 RepID=A0A1M6BD41_9FIRM|nr:DUF4275 family protein [Lutispora thermophila]SHI46652.1 protein of unknown function [Lutispora thermophila DSM 19022]
MELVNILRNKGVMVTEINKWGTYLRKQWEDNFANHLSHKEKRDIYLLDNGGFCGYLWHLFSYEKKDCMKGEEAEKFFNDENKDSCYVFWQHTDYALILENAGLLKSSDFEDEHDVYVVDKEFNWTYVKTHETGLCGPYFSRK